MAGFTMTRLTTVGSMFEARVLVARLGADGIIAQTNGAPDGTYPLPGTVDVLVEDDRLEEARQLLLTDQVEAVFDGDARRGPHVGRPKP